MAVKLDKVEFTSLHQINNHLAVLQNAQIEVCGQIELLETLVEELNIKLNAKKLESSDLYKIINKVQKIRAKW